MDKPILFSAPMVRAILDGRKTQTRRVIKQQPGQVTPAGRPLFFQHGETGRRVSPTCPYGEAGDLLWVRETHHLSHRNAVTYRADFGFNPFSEDECGEDHSMVGEKWKPSIFMPRWASRITLEIIGVRVERLHAISREDIRAEGVDLPFSPRFAPEDGISELHKEWRHLWQSINGSESWEANPWVWVVEFRPIIANIDQVKNAA